MSESGPASSGTLVFSWRADFDNDELTILHSAAFGHPVGINDARDRRTAARTHSLGWVTARRGHRLVGFVNVAWDGLDHAWLQDVVVDPYLQRRGIGTRLVREAALAATEAGCEWLHVDFDAVHTNFYITQCGFRPTDAGILHLASSEPVDPIV
jgi:ribosomal protein S18 acetylase RimI-like enzyme